MKLLSNRMFILHPLGFPLPVSRCSDCALANHKVVTDLFRSVFTINDSIAEGTAGVTSATTTTTTTSTSAPIGSTTTCGCTTTISVTTSTSCAIATSVAVTFGEEVTTPYGETIKMSGDVAALGDWDTSDAIALSAADYTSNNPL
jgi:hypothetical protein